MDIVKEILIETFGNDKSVQDVVKQDSKKEERLKNLLDYALFKGESQGEIYLNRAKTACAIVIDSEKRISLLQTVFLNFKLAYSVVGFINFFRVLKRETIIQRFYPSSPYLYLWFIGVKGSEKGNGEGTKLIKEIIDKRNGKSICLVSSNERNFSFYERNGFKSVANLTKEMGYSLRIYRYR
tara:strand:+ start:957 stop:1502 length:546 start_codon:yes stop_codon:yes gene_type:complete